MLYPRLGLVFMVGPDPVRSVHIVSNVSRFGDGLYKIGADPTFGALCQVNK